MLRIEIQQLPKCLSRDMPSQADIDFISFIHPSLANIGYFAQQAGKGVSLMIKKSDVRS